MAAQRQRDAAVSRLLQERQLANRIKHSFDWQVKARGITQQTQACRQQQLAGHPAHVPRRRAYPQVGLGMAHTAADTRAVVIYQAQAHTWVTG